jgi:hypothetical protein
MRESGRNGRDVDGDVSGDEAVWRDLIARYEMPAAADAVAMPWPERENLQYTARDPALHGSAAPPAREPDQAPDDEGPSRPPGAGETDAADSGAAPAAHGDRRVPGTSADRTRVVRPAQSVPRPPAADASSREEKDEDDRYVPPPPPPLPKLDSVGKGAWAALFGGPAYLVVATILNWSVSSWAALAAVTAFVGGFTVVILRMGDGPSRGDGPENGAVV